MSFEQWFSQILIGNALRQFEEDIELEAKLREVGGEKPCACPQCQGETEEQCALMGCSCCVKNGVHV